MTDRSPEKGAGAAAHASPLSPAKSPSEDASLASDEEPPTGHVITDSYAEAADPAGEVTSTKQVPAPDSLGG